MIETGQHRGKTAPDFDKNRAGRRTPKAIRFSESEWKRIKTAATARGISIGGFVRDAALAQAAAGSTLHSAPLSPGMEELIKHTFRYVFILTSITRDRLIDEGLREIVDNAVQRARAAQAELLPGSEDFPPRR